MRPAKDLSKEEERVIRSWLDKAKSAATLRRVLCLWLRSNGHKAKDIATMIGWSIGQVQKIQSEFMSSGEVTFAGPGKGGRRHQHLNDTQETMFVNSLRDKDTGVIYLRIPEIKKSFEIFAQLPENSVNLSIIYRLLKRHGYKSLELQDGRRVFSN